MKKLTALLSAVLLSAAVASPGFAQFSAGGRAGISFATLRGDWSTRTGFSVGGFFGHNFHEFFAVQPELQFVMKGARQEDVDFEQEIKVSYLELLVPATLTLPTGRDVQPRVYAGPAVALKLTCKAEVKSFRLVVAGDCDDPDVGRDAKSIDFGLVFGAGVDFGVGNGAITADVRYNLGLTNSNDVPGEPEEVKNRVWQILVGYAFFFGS